MQATMKQNILIVIVVIAAIMVCGKSLQFTDQANAAKQVVHSGDRKAPAAISGDNVYVAWWTNETGNDEVMFRASNDAGQIFGDKINLSNTTDSDSTRVEIDSDADRVVVTWWERNQTDDTPVMRASNDNGATFGPMLMLVTNGTIGEAEEGE